MDKFYFIQTTTTFFYEDTTENDHEKFIERLTSSEEEARDFCRTPRVRILAENVIEHRYIIEIPLNQSGPFKIIAAYDHNGKEINCKEMSTV